MQKNGTKSQGNGRTPVFDPTRQVSIALDAILPQQFHDHGGKLSGCQRLYLAILHDSLSLLLTPPRPTQRPADRLKVDEALEWVRSENTRWPASFHNVCTALGLAPEYLRPRILALRQQVVHGAAARPRLHRGAQAGNGSGKIGG